MEKTLFGFPTGGRFFDFFDREIIEIVVRAPIEIDHEAELLCNEFFSESAVGCRFHDDLHLLEQQHRRQ